MFIVFSEEINQLKMENTTKTNEINEKKNTIQQVGNNSQLFKCSFGSTVIIHRLIILPLCKVSNPTNCFSSQPRFGYIDLNGSKSRWPLYDNSLLSFPPSLPLSGEEDWSSLQITI